MSQVTKILVQCFLLLLLNCFLLAHILSPSYLLAAKASMIWIIGEYAERIDNADELLESFLESFPEEPPQVQLQLLTATVKLFLKKPTEGPQQMIQVFHLHASCIFSASYLFWLYHVCICKDFTNGYFLWLDIIIFTQKHFFLIFLYMDRGGCRQYPFIGNILSYVSHWNYWIYAFLCLSYLVIQVVLSR